VIADVARDAIRVIHKTWRFVVDLSSRGAVVKAGGNSIWVIIGRALPPSPLALPARLEREKQHVQRVAPGASGQTHTSYTSAAIGHIRASRQLIGRGQG
jgi:hypothetical protein